MQQYWRPLYGSPYKPSYIVTTQIVLRTLIQAVTRTGDTRLDFARVLHNVTYTNEVV